MIQIQRLAPNMLRVLIIDQGGRGTKDAMDLVAEWSLSVGVGRRMSYDMWSFNSEADATAFALRWDGYVPS